MLKAKRTNTEPERDFVEELLEREQKKNRKAASEDELVSDKILMEINR